jgi:choline dehydrogenase-like flavoprotein
MTYTRAEDVQIDAWEAIGNRGWNWANLYPYYKKSEDFTPPTAAQIDAGASYNAAYHGYSGPLTTGNQYNLLNSSLFATDKATWGVLGIPPTSDFNGGHVRGYALWQSTVDRDANVREDAARAYYYPVQGRPNLEVFLNTTGNKIVWSNTTDHEATAAGVEVTAANGTVYVIGAKREVILSAGSLRSPAILELSGVGSPSILSKYGIATKVALPAVGENLQDQPNSAITLASNNTFQGYGPYVTFGTMADIYGASDVASLASSTKAGIPSWAATISAASNEAISASALEYLFQIQHSLIFDRAVPNAEIITSGAGGFLFAAFWVLLPFSRGRVHIASADPRAYPSIDPAFFGVDDDVHVQAAIARLVRRFWATEPMGGLVQAELLPGLAAVPANATDAQWVEWVKSSCELVPCGFTFIPFFPSLSLPPHFHEIFSASLLSRTC